LELSTKKEIISQQMMVATSAFAGMVFLHAQGKPVHHKVAC
jgi:hypothetical protein